MWHLLFLQSWINAVSPKQFGERITVKHCFFFSFWIKRGNFQFCIAKTTRDGECKLSKKERILWCSILGIHHRRRFHLSLARKHTSSFARSWFWEEFVVLWPISLFVFNFFRLNFNIIEPCPKVMYLCTFSLRRNASRLSHDTVSPRCASWKSKKQRKHSW